MLFRKPTLAEIAAGRVTLAFRRWRKPTVRAGGTLTTAVGVLAIDAVDVLTETAVRKIPDADLRAAGAESREALLDELNARDDGRVHRIAFHVAGPDPRIAARADADLDADALAAILAKLARLDAASRRGPWTATFLRLIRDRPAVRAPELAEGQGLATDVFKRDVRKLKALGLTESLDGGYRISPRGAKVLAAVTRATTGRTTRRSGGSAPSRRRSSGAR